MRARFTSYEVPGWGVGELWTGEAVVLAHEFRFGAAGAPPAAPPKGAHGPPSGTVSITSERMSDEFVPSSEQTGERSERVDLAALTDRLAGFLSGDDIDLSDVPIDLEWATPFQRAVAEALRRIPRGEVVSYGELAALAGHAGAARAAGAYCAQNRFMFIVPCHRVVGAAGLGGYGSAGLETKRRLLELEGVVL